MFKRLIVRLGKVVQKALKIFSKEKPQQEKSLLGCQVSLNSGGVLFIDDSPIGVVSEIYQTTDEPAKLMRDLHWNQEFTFSSSLDPDLSKELKNLANTAYPILPRLIKVPTLLVSLYADYEYDSKGVDISQLEETGIAHYWITTTKSIDWWNHELYGDDEELYMPEEDGCATAYIQNATLIEWEDGSWSWYY